MKNEFRRGRHSVSDLKFHFICVTKYRRKILTPESLALIEESMKQAAKEADIKILEINGEADQVHVLLEMPPKLSVSKVANILKGVSSRTYTKAGFKKPHPKHLWSPSYFCSTVGGAPIEKLQQYIEEQSRPKRGGA